MREVRKGPVKIRKRWAINPKTRIKEKKSLYKRVKEKKEPGEYETTKEGFED